MKKAGYDVDFVGSERDFGGNVDQGLWDFDRDHEGYSSAKIEDINKFLSRAISGYDVDIALVHAGTNDIYAGQSPASAVAEMEYLFKTLRRHNQNVTILLALIIPMRETSVSDFNSALKTWAENQSTATSQVIIVDQNSGFNAMEDTFDTWHPNLSGELKMAIRWYSALKKVLNKNLVVRKAVRE